MRILALATAGPFASVGFADGASAPVIASLGDGTERGRGILREIDRLLTGLGVTRRDLEGVAVEVGPGSFTGVRVGVSTAKAIAFGLTIPIVGIVSLDALALAAGPTDREILSLRDARSGEAFFAIYRANAPSDDGSLALPKRLQKPTRGPAALIRQYLDERAISKVLAVGEDAERLALTLPLSGLLAGVRTPPVTPAEVLAWARPRFENGTTDDADAIAPLYLQPSTPEKLLAEKVLAEKAAKQGGSS